VAKPPLAPYNRESPEGSCGRLSFSRSPMRLAAQEAPADEHLDEYSSGLNNIMKTMEHVQKNAIENTARA